MHDTLREGTGRPQSASCELKSTRRQTTEDPCFGQERFCSQGLSSVFRALHMRQLNTMPPLLAPNSRRPPHICFRSTAGTLSIYHIQYRFSTRLTSYSYFCFLALAFLFVLDAMIFEKFHVNYPFIFELDTRSTINWRQLAELPSAFACILGICMWLNFNPSIGDATMYIYWPIILIGVSHVAMRISADILAMPLIHNLPSALWLSLTKLRYPSSYSLPQYQASSTPIRDGG